MNLIRMVVLSLMVGVVAAGFTWFAWDFAVNVRAVVAARRAKAVPPTVPAEKPRK